MLSFIPTSGPSKALALVNAIFLCPFLELNHIFNVTTSSKFFLCISFGQLFVYVPREHAIQKIIIVLFPFTTSPFRFLPFKREVNQRVALIANRSKVTQHVLTTSFKRYDVMILNFHSTFLATVTTNSSKNPRPFCFMCYFSAKRTHDCTIPVQYSAIMRLVNTFRIYYTALTNN